MPVLSWALRQNGVSGAVQAIWADLRILHHPPSTLRDRIRTALDLYPCDLLFVHRDCEGMSFNERRSQLLQDIGAAAPLGQTVVMVLPRRMTEAWFVVWEDAVRNAAGNPTGHVQLNIPHPAAIENIPDPKETLFALLRTASELQGRRLHQLPVRRLVHRVAELVEDYSTLRAAPAFDALMDDLEEVVRTNGWQ